MSIIPAEFLEKRLSKRLNINQFYMVKIIALDQLMKMVGLKGRNPYSSGEKPYETNLIILLFLRVHMQNIPKYCLIATSRLLDYYCPAWREFADKRIIGEITYRNNKEVRKWAKEVFKRDNYKCQDCESKVNLHAHHIAHWAQYPELRTDLDNGVTLCGKCHAQQHGELSPNMFIQGVN